MRLWFIGGGSFAARCLEALVRRLPVELVVTGTPTRGGRGMAEIPSRVEERALALGLPLERTGPLGENEPLLTALAANPPDAILVVDFAQLIREPFLSVPRWGCLNVHPSLLPRWRGAAPVPRSLMDGDVRTGVTVFRLTPEMDAGPILRQAAVEVGAGETATELYDRLSALGAEIAAAGLSALESAGDCFAGLFTPQDDAAASYAAKLARSEFELSWRQPAERLDRAVRALEASGGAFVMVREKRLKVWRAAPAAGGHGEPGTVLALQDGALVVACAAGALHLEEVQAEGKRRVPAADWARGLRLVPGDVL